MSRARTHRRGKTRSSKINKGVRPTLHKSKKQF